MSTIAASHIGPQSGRRWRRLWWAAAWLVLVLFALDRLFPPPIPDVFGASAVVVLARDGTPLRAFADADGVWRYPVRIEDVDPRYLDTLLSYEDRWFFRHPGVNPAALARAVLQGVRHGELVSGGSTLTMQVARLIEPIPHSLSGKFRQIFRAVQLELRLSKHEILELYLNLAPFGGTIEGVQAASFAYLGKPAKQLTLAEAALLAVLPQRPSALRPDRAPKRAQQARDKVLDRLAALGLREPAEIADARRESVTTRSLKQPMLAPLLAERLKQANPGQSRIQTTVDAEWQRIAENRLLAYLDRFPESTSAAALVIDNPSLEVRAYVGSAAFADVRRLGHVDMVQASRSPGSTLKPFLYGMALDAGLIHSESLLLDVPQSFGGYAPGNFAEAFNGPVSAAQALRLSLNVPAVDLLDRIGPARFAAALDNAGLRLEWPAGGTPNLSLILGGAGARMDQLAALYAGLARGGEVSALRYTAEQAVAPRWLLSPGAAWIVREMLSARLRPAAGEATLFDPGSLRALAWKTGTSYGFRDAWAFGTREDRTIAVWIGRPDGTPLPGSFGVVSALPLLTQLDQALPQERRSAAPRPVTVERTDICWPLGLKYDPDLPSLCHRRFEAWTLEGVVPPTLPARAQLVWSPGLLRVAIEARSGLRLSAACVAQGEVRLLQVARWPSILGPWLSPRIHALSRLPPLKSGCGADPQRDEPLVIEGVRGQALLTPAGGRGSVIQLDLRALGASGTVFWLLDGKPIGQSPAERSWRHQLDQNGAHRLVAIDSAGRHGEVSFRVLGVL